MSGLQGTDRSTGHPEIEIDQAGPERGLRLRRRSPETKFLVIMIGSKIVTGLTTGRLTEVIDSEIGDSLRMYGRLSVSGAFLRVTENPCLGEDLGLLVVTDHDPRDGSPDPEKCLRTREVFALCPESETGTDSPLTATGQHPRLTKNLVTVTLGPSRLLVTDSVTTTETITPRTRGGGRGRPCHGTGLPLISTKPL